MLLIGKEVCICIIMYLVTTLWLYQVVEQKAVSLKEVCDSCPGSDPPNISVVIMVAKWVMVLNMTDCYCILKSSDWLYSPRRYEGTQIEQSLTSLTGRPH